MSIWNEINRISGNIFDTYAVAQNMGASIPPEMNSANLPETIRSISQGIPEAPIDNNQYARRNADWSIIDPARQLNPRGEFVLGNTYNTNDLVYHDGAEWIATIDGIVLPPPSMGWDLFVDRGQPGLSAYELAVQEGFVGSLTEWLASLRGEMGQIGPQGLQGQTGATGAPGTSVTVRKAANETEANSLSLTYPNDIVFWV